MMLMGQFARGGYIEQYGSDSTEYISIDSGPGGKHWQLRRNKG